MNSFELSIYPQSSQQAKWHKCAAGELWQKYQYFYFDGKQSVVGIDLTNVWQKVLDDKIDHYEADICCDEMLGSYPKVKKNTVQFKVVIDAKF